MLVKDIMNTNVKVAKLTTPIREIAVIMCFNKISGVPVVNENNEITARRRVHRHPGSTG